MNLSNRTKAIINIISWLVFITLITIMIIIGAKNKKFKAENKQLKAEVENLQQKIETLEDNIYKLGAEEVLSVTCNINIKSTNVMGVNTINSNNLAKEIAQMTRKELYDSIYGPKRENYNYINIDTTDNINKSRK